MGDIDFLSLPIGNNLWYNDRNRAGTTSGVIEPMTFTVRDFHDLVEIMETQPIWRAEMRRLVLTEDILNLPQEIQALSRSVAELAEITKRNEARLAKLEVELATSTARNEAHFMQIDKRFTRIDTDIAALKQDVADLKGDNLERRVSEHPFTYLSRFARRVKLVEDAEWGRLLEDALDEARITEVEADAQKVADIIAWGQDRETRTDLYLVGEVSWTVAESDIARALTRAALFQKATGVKTMPVVLGRVIPETMRTQAIATGIGWVVLPE
jgi:hypothetical protein